MAAPSVTYTFTNGTTANGTYVSANFTDLINALTDGTKDLTIGALTTKSGVVFNEDSADVDFRVEGNGDANLLFCDAGNDRIGIGTSTPSERLSFGGDALVRIVLERVTTDTTGNLLILRAGGAYSGGTDKNGGALYLDSGTSTGSGSSPIYLRTVTAGQSGTTDRTQSTKMTILGSGNVGIGTASPGVGLHISNSSYPQLEIDDAASRGWGFGVTSSNFFVRDITGSADVMSFNPSGYVGINVAAPDRQFQVSTALAAGYVVATWYKSATAANATSNYYMTFVSGGTEDGHIWNDGSGVLAFAQASDKKLKTNIRDSIHGIDTVMKIRPVTFDWIDKPHKNVNGFIAQELEQVLPTAVSDGPDGYKVISTSQFIPILTQAIKDLKNEITELRSKING